MAKDGSGGLVYLKRVVGVPHVFVSRYVGGSWQAPIQVDEGEPYAASWPRIGAAEDGELMVVWATPFATRKEKPVVRAARGTARSRCSKFGPAMIIDSDIEEATGTSPDLAVSSTGQADVVYRVVETSAPTVPLLRPGDVVESVRVAHFDGERWSDLGAINRDPGVSMRPPTQANAPQIAIGPTGNGAGRLAGAGNRRRRADLGQAAVRASRSTTCCRSAPTTLQRRADRRRRRCAEHGGLMAGSGRGRLPPERGARLAAAGSANLPEHPARRRIGRAARSSRARASSIPRCRAASRPRSGRRASTSTKSEDLRLLYDSNGTPRVIEGNDHGLSGALSLGPPFAGSEPIAASVMNPQAEAFRRGRAPTRRAIRRWRSARTSPAAPSRPRSSAAAPAAKSRELAVGRSGLGDGLVAFRQGPFGNAAIVAAQATAPASEVIVSAPKGWVKPSQALISWEPAAQCQRTAAATASCWTAGRCARPPARSCSCA